MPRTAAVNKTSRWSPLSSPSLSYFCIYSLTTHTLSVSLCLLLLLTAAVGISPSSYCVPLLLSLFIDLRWATVTVSHALGHLHRRIRPRHIRCIPEIYTIFYAPRSSHNFASDSSLYCISAWTTAWKTLRTLRPKPARPRSWVLPHLATTPRASLSGWSSIRQQGLYK